MEYKKCIFKKNRMICDTAWADAICIKAAYF